MNIIIFFHNMWASLIDFFNFVWFGRLVLSSVLASLAVALVGPLVVKNKLSHATGGLGHALLSGVGIAYYFSIEPFWGGLIATVVLSLIVSAMRVFLKKQDDFLIIMLWTCGMAIGILFVHLKEGYSVDLMTFLFGSIVVISWQLILMLLLLNVILFIIFFVWHPQIALLCFDEEYAVFRGISAFFIWFGIYWMIGLSVLILMRTVGLLLMLAFLTLPAAMLGNKMLNFWQQIGLCFLLSFLFISAGFVISYLCDLPSGIVTILITTTTYLVFQGFKLLKNAF